MVFDERRFEHDLASQADLTLAECRYWVRNLQDALATIRCTLESNQ